MAESQRSAASMSYDNYGSEGPAADRSTRANLTWEAQRKTGGAEAVARYAQQNPAINTEMTQFNVDRVNDGAGGFRETRVITEVVAYGDARRERLGTALKAGNRHAVTSVGHLPWAYCEPDGTYYQPVDGRGEPKVHQSGPNAGGPILEPRYRIREDRREEAMRYFRDWIEYQAQILPGGQESIHGYSINLDESRPHIQMLADTFEAAPTKKNPDALKNGYSRAFGSHPKDGLVPSLDNAGKPILNDDGSELLVREGPRRKMERYQAGLRSFMVERGYEVDLERDAERHDRHLSLQDYKDLQHSQREVSDTAQDLGARAVELEDEHAVRVEALAETVMEEHNAATAELTAAEQRAAEVVAEAEAVVHDYVAGTEAQADENLRMFTQALSAERAEVLATARTEAEQITTEAQARADEIISAATAEADTRKRELDTRETELESEEGKLKRQAAALKKRLDGLPILETDAESRGLAAARTAWDEVEGPAYRATVRAEVESTVRQEMADEKSAAVAEGRRDGLAQADALVKEKLAVAEAERKKARRARADAKEDRELIATDRKMIADLRWEAERDALRAEQLRNEYEGEFERGVAHYGASRWIVDAMRREPSPRGEPGKSALDHYIEQGRNLLGWASLGKEGAQVPNPEQTVGEGRGVMKTTVQLEAEARTLAEPKKAPRFGEDDG